MPFDDGTNISSALPLLAPYAYHPDAPVTGVPLAYDLSQSYLYSRTHSRLIGVQTYRQSHVTSAVDTRAILQTSLTGIAEYRVQLPVHATHIVCTAYFQIVGEHNSFEVSHRVDISDGVDNDVGTAVVTEGQSGPSGALNLNGWTFYDYAGAHAVEFAVERVTTSDAATSTVCTIVASAFAVEAGTSNALPYRPLAIVCRWESI